MSVPSPREKVILGKIVSILRRHLDPQRIILFGSRGKGRFQKGADFDIAVDEEIPGIRKEREISEALEEAAGLHKVDVIYLKSVEKEFKEIVLKTGKILYERRNESGH